jgi:hypothetical protein
MSDHLHFEAAYLLITHGGVDNALPTPRPAIGIITDPTTTVAETWAGSPLTPEAVERAACDAGDHGGRDPRGGRLHDGHARHRDRADHRQGHRDVLGATHRPGEAGREKVGYHSFGPAQLDTALRTTTSPARIHSEAGRPRREHHHGLVRLAGIMGVVIQSGRARAGDPIEVSLPPPPHHPLTPV